MSTFDDDEPIVIPPASDSERKRPLVEGLVQLVIINNNNIKAPLEANNQKVMLQLTGDESTRNRSGLDLVAVLDVSSSMRGPKMEKMKTAMQFVVKKLSTIDRLCVVTFADNAARLCPLRQVTKTSQPELEDLINDIKPGRRTNIREGLETGLRVLAERKLSDGRVAGVMFMSDGRQNRGGDAAEVDVDDVPVYTFGFGANHDPVLLHAIAEKSMGGTFSVVNDIADLSLAFSQCLAGLLTVVVKDLKLTVERIEDESTIQEVRPGSYRQAMDADAGSVTVNFGDLYSKEVRKVIVDLQLPAAPIGISEYDADVLEIRYSYISSGKSVDPSPARATVLRTGRADPDGEKQPEVETEETRLQTAKIIKEATTMAGEEKLEEARDILVDAQNELEDIVEHASPLVDMLRTELQQLVKLMRTKEVFEKQGRSYALSSMTSHGRQRFAARGDIEVLRLFATPRMDRYLEQASKFDEDPTVPPPSADDDVKEEMATNPLVTVAGPITFYLQVAIQALQAIGKLVGKGALA